MVLSARFSLSILLASHLIQIGDATNSIQLLDENRNDRTETPTGLLRGGRFGGTGKKPIIPRSNNGMEDARDQMIEPLYFGNMNRGTPTNSSSSNKLKHVIISCKPEEDEFSCKKRILDAVPKDSIGRFRLINYLQLSNAYAAEITDDDTSVLDSLEGDVFADPPRETMHIKDSVKVHRRLQSSSGQVLPYGIEMVKAMDVWEKYKVKGENVRVCVMDTGVNRDHPDLAAQRLLGYDGNELVQPWWRDIDGHGTHVTGTIAASDNSKGVVGVAPGAEIFSARVFSTNGEFFSSNIITALQVCKDAGANVISMSLGGPQAIYYEQQAYEDLHDKYGIVTVAASGNTGGYDLMYPAAYDKVISVGSVGYDRGHSSFSTRNSKVDVAAPGSGILSTWENGSYATVSGTSMACPHVSGVVALMLSSNPSATPAQIFTALEKTSENPRSSGRDDNIGHGIVNALAAVEEISNYSSDDDAVGKNNGNNDSNASGSSGSNNDNNNSGCVEVVINLRTDRYGSETSHWMQTGTTYLFYQDGFDSFESYRETACVDPTLCTVYNIRDEFGDGIKGEGLEIRYGGEMVYTGGDFGVGGIKYLGNC
mmetsp:Transcript_13777/g.29031  ORF Transcript_13777/g.29031 Transcript_13777/m.29031 type:complete len:595 (-) Transcript_13777:96-1880(-)|eukprot:CAMPEP_0201122828 /NCGR_PEP_ID=MMETSP0850-20130426/6359_1 /ASSEMBLY_ACC=CAM_ASM_000622 /TAXON_ID=183588 /ORGANISM="Pseudo-nitzschia fraudulenta, Strain WWA7" /LENGTH=594 /DNA_ID=CAMNT_0047389601 /DNA_START=133 /DNA_END=1917 /DNA_ORIENTATION=+